ncbi:hypothetical protein BDQ17DRAFT_1167650, partial [Cyathus striatus]
GRTPYEKVHGTIPFLGDLLLWGSQVWVHDPDAGKIHMHACLGQWVGYDGNSNGHHIYWP